MFCRYLFLVFLAVATAAPALAGVDSSSGQGLPLPPIVMPRGSDFTIGPYYNQMVRQAIDKRPKDFDFGLLRSYYPQTEQYDPLGTATRRKMIDIAYTIDNSSSSEARDKAFDEYGAMISAHLANLDVVNQALVLSREDKIYGDPAFFEWMRRGLLRNVMGSGDGRNLFGAYNVITLGEETILLNALQLKVLKTDSAESGSVYYNMHEVQSKKSPAPYWIFVDVSVPLHFLEQQKQEKGNTFTIPRQ